MASNPVEYNIKYTDKTMNVVGLVSSEQHYNFFIMSMCDEYFEF